jgi:hypothetical protein
MSDFTLSCTNQRKQRSRFFYHEAGDSSSRLNIISPYIYATNNQLVYTQNDFNMRRKAEILKYNNNSNLNNNNKQKYSFLSKKTTKTKKCPDSNNAKPSSSSDVPGKIIQLSENTDVPLYKYKDISKQFTFSNIPFDNFKRIFDQFPFFNTFNNNDAEVNIMDIIILNPDNNQFRFNFSIPICIQFEADFEPIQNINTDIATAQIAIFSSLLKVFYSDSLISENNIAYRSEPEVSSDIVKSTFSVSLDFQTSETGKIRFSQYVGNIIVNNVTLQTITQYVYTILLKTNIGYAEYIGDINNTDAYRTNNEGDNIGNINEKNVKNVSYRLITNFDNNDPTFFNSSENCVLAIFNDAGQLITDEERQFKPFSLTAEPV